MNYLLVFAVLVIVVPYSRGHHTEPEKIKLSSEPGYYYPTKKSDHHYEHQTGPPSADVEENYQTESKADDAPSNYEFYKPLTNFERYGPSEEDSKYIPHSKEFSKYINPKGYSNSKSEHAWKDEEETKSEEIPRYGFSRQNHPDTHHKEDINENSENIRTQHYEESDKPTYGAHSQHKYHEEDTEHHKNYPENKEEYRNNDYPDHKDKHSHQHHYSEHKEHEHHPYPDKKNERGQPHYADHGEYNQHHYPEHKEKQNHHYYPEHQSEERHPHYPQHEHNNHHYPKHEVKYHHYSEPKSEQKPHPGHNVEYGHHYHHGIKEHDDHHTNDKHTLQDQHWKDNHPGPLATLNGDALIDEIRKSKPHYFLDKKSKILHEDKVSHAPDVEELIGKHKEESHKNLQFLNEELHHKNKLDDSNKDHHYLDHYPHQRKNHEHHQKPIVHYKPNFNVGGHSYGWMYNPKFDIYQEMKKDLAIKMRLLKEHEEKLAELQRNHLKKYRALFEPHHMKKFLKHEMPEHILRNIEPKHSLQSESYGAHEHENSPPVKYDSYSKEPAVSYTPKHYHPHPESHHPKHDSRYEEHKHNSPHHHPHNDSHHPRHDIRYEEHKHNSPHHHPHNDSHHPKHDSRYEEHKYSSRHHHPHHDSHHPKHDSRYEEHKHNSPHPQHSKESYTP